MLSPEFALSREDANDSDWDSDDLLPDEDDLTEASLSQSTDSDNDEEDEDEDDGCYHPNEVSLEELSTVKKFLATASPPPLPTNVMMMTGQHNVPVEIRPFIEDAVYEGIVGPMCHLCDKEICPDDERVVIENNVFNLIWENEIVSSKDEKDQDNLDCSDSGILQCVYCFNVYHRFNCSLTMSKASYIKAKQSKQWSCPSCVPEFVPQHLTLGNDSANVKNVNCNSDNLLCNMLKRLLFLLETHDPLKFKSYANRVMTFLNSDINSLYELG